MDDEVISMLERESRFFMGMKRSEIQTLTDVLERLDSFLQAADSKSVQKVMSRSAKSWAQDSAEFGQVVEADSLLKLSQLLQESRVVDFIGGVNRRFRRLTESRSQAPDTQGSKKNEESVFSFMDEYIESVMDDLTTWLVQGPSKRAVLSLMGPAGIGKTTLARKVYDHCTAGDHFDLCAWIDVSSSQYSPEDLIKAMLKLSVREEVEEFPSTVLIDILRGSLESKRYMFVFDDIFCEDFRFVLRVVLPYNKNGSRIIFITRTKITSDYTLKLEPLSEKGSLDLFCRIAFKENPGLHCPSELEQLSIDIIRMCKGFPLPIVAVAGLLSTKDKTVSEWSNLLHNFRLEIPLNLLPPDLLKVLALSFLDLPNHLQPCFLYLSIFPQDHSIPKDKLLKLWIAEGFIEEKIGKRLEEVAEDYLNELIQRSLVHASQPFYGLEQFCQVHRLVYNIAQLKANELKFGSIWDDKNSRFTGKSPRLSIYNVVKFSKIIEDSEVRAIYLFNVGAIQNSFLVTLIGKCELLTLLDFEYLPIENLPEELGNLVHLKYLSLKNTKVRTLPKSMNKLQKLQTLNLRNTLVFELPIEIYCLENLQHLIASLYYTRGVRVNEGIRYLLNLKTLTIADVYNGSVALVNELLRLTQLQSLGISGMTEEIARAFFLNIQEFVHLEFLTLQAKDSYEILNQQTASSPLPPLRRLVLKGKLQKLPNWILGLQNLSILCLSLSMLNDDPLIQLSQMLSLVSLWLYQAYQGERLYFEKDGFENLKLLVLSNLDGLNSVEIEHGALPLLEEMRIGQNPLLNQVPFGIEHLRNLKVLSNYEMPREFVLSMQPNGGSDYWKVERVKSVLFLYKYQERSYKFFKLGESDLLDHLQGLHTNADVVEQNHHDFELSFCHNEEEEDIIGDMSFTDTPSCLSKNTRQWSFPSTFGTDDVEQ